MRMPDTVLHTSGTNNNHHDLAPRTPPVFRHPLARTLQILFSLPQRLYLIMSGWGLGWFGGGQAKKEAPKKAILQLRGQLEMLNKREKHLQNQMEEQDTLARKYVSSNKAAAKAALRRKKQFEHSLEQTSAQIMTLEREIYSIETANINKETLDAMKNAGTAMKQIHAGLTIDKVDNVMEDLREQHAIGEEISEAITSGVTTGGIDEDELDEELAELQQEKLDEDMLKTGNVPVGDKVAVGRMPAAPATEVRGKAPQRVEEDDEEEELRKLQAEMAM
ncbi:ESCRT-III subunit protein snf7 [Neodidymelliopsis sp. IMI 364377]|nr:ESCRT-III subunit protein snf7 [Neodidymelliopsis sp. IMI 364377]